MAADLPGNAPLAFPLLYQECGGFDARVLYCEECAGDNRWWYGQLMKGENAQKRWMSFFLKLLLVNYENLLFCQRFKGCTFPHHPQALMGTITTRIFT